MRTKLFAAAVTIAATAAGFVGWTIGTNLSVDCFEECGIVDVTFADTTAEFIWGDVAHWSLDIADIYYCSIAEGGCWEH